MKCFINNHYHLHLLLSRFNLLFDNKQAQNNVTKRPIKFIPDNAIYILFKLKISIQLSNFNKGYIFRVQCLYINIKINHYIQKISNTLSKWVLISKNLSNLRSLIGQNYTFNFPHNN